jgi:hypothetical protein
MRRTQNLSLFVLPRVQLYGGEGVIIFNLEGIRIAPKMNRRSSLVPTALQCNRLVTTSVSGLQVVKAQMLLNNAHCGAKPVPTAQGTREL